MDNNVAAVVVTYNRKELLIQCIYAIKNQTKKPKILFIIDNLSDDGTPTLLRDEGIITSLPSDFPIKNETYKSVLSNQDGSTMDVIYLRKSENDGGAGGFYAGLKMAFESGVNWIWLMDDDGVPKKDQLEKLVNNSNEYAIDFSNALVVNKDSTDLLAFGLGKNRFVKDVEAKKIIEKYANPFNGTLLNRTLVNEIGYIKKEMFIWGDEAEYMNRALKNGYKVATVTDAIHYHPKSKSDYASIIPGLTRPKIEIKPTEKMYIYCRNKAYNLSRYASKNVYYWEFAKYIMYYLIRFRFKNMNSFIKAFRDGKNNIFMN